ncbi:hypothetical protein EDD21DRAFT_414814 [Dissophora ornata]|nr:hypothetical protein EDD21DRAFT_414814 [Dissophora ornata]
MASEFTQPRAVPMMVDPTQGRRSAYSQQAPTSPLSPRSPVGYDNTPRPFGAPYTPDDAAANNNRPTTDRYSGRGRQDEYTYTSNINALQDSQPQRYSVLQQSQDPLRQSLGQQQTSSPPQSSYGNEGARVVSYQPTSPMQAGPRSPSLDYSQAPMSPLPPYVARPPPAMQPPQYYQEVHHETQAAGQMNYMEMDDRIGYNGGQGRGSTWTPNGGRGSRNDEEMLYQSAGQFNPEGNRGWKKWSGNSKDGEEKESEVWSFVKDIAECCPCFCLCCICFSALN